MAATLAYVNLLSADIDRQMRYYQDLFGFAEITAHRAPIHRALNAGGCSLGFNAREAFDLLGLERGPGAMRDRWFVTFELDDAAAVDVAVERACALGGALVKPASATGYRWYQAVLRDPEGNAFRINTMKGGVMPGTDAVSPEAEDSSVAIISLGASRGFDAASSRRAAAAIARAAISTGFFYVVDHGVETQVTDRVLKLAGRFFDQPIETKLAVDVALSPIMRGYERIGLQALDLGTPADLKESLMFGRDLGADHPLVRAGTPMEGPNPWPEGVDGLKVGVNAYIEAVTTLGRRLAALIALSLDLEPSYFEDALGDPNCAVRLLRYPPQGNERHDQIGCGAHTDWGFLTILLQDASGGLEIQDRSGRWIAAPPVEGSFVINLGDMIPVLTNQRYRSSPHRVINRRSSNNRHSVATFFNPQYDYVFECVSTCLVGDDTPPDPVSYGAHLAKKLAETYSVA
jgi:isopenicillin N synthase-like dioxygenase/predicted enzyme related to lactoylglutathione lyase